MAMCRGVPRVSLLLPAATLALAGMGIVATAGTTMYIPCVPAGASCQNLTGFNNVPASHVAAGSLGSGGLGGANPHPVLHANNGLGTTITNGALSITAPTNALDGTYLGTVTFNIIGG